MELHRDVTDLTQPHTSGKNTTQLEQMSHFRLIISFIFKQKCQILVPISLMRRFTAFLCFLSL